MANCQICDCELNGEPAPSERADKHLCDCRNCGRYFLHGRLGVGLSELRRADPRPAALVSHVIWQMQRNSKTPVEVDQAAWDRWNEQVPIPTPFEQAENLLLWLASVSIAVGDIRHIDLYYPKAAVGAITSDNFIAVLQ